LRAVMGAVLSSGRALSDKMDPVDSRFTLSAL
jgi:hypothetical protein